MEVAKVVISGVCAKPKNCKTLTSGMIGATVTFEFEDPMWTGLNKTVVYKTVFGTRDDLNMGADGVSRIPPDMLQRSGVILDVGVYGVNADGTLVVPTVWASLGHIKSGADPSGDPGAAPELPPWHQLRQDVGDLEELDTEDKSNLVAAVNEVAKKNGITDHRELTNADWNASEGEPGHVKNRTHYEGFGVLLEETEAHSFTQPGFGKMWMVRKAPELKVGETYRVLYNGTFYTCVCQTAPAGLIEDPNAVAMGNFSVVGGANTGEPFAMLVSHAHQQVVIIDLTGAASVKVGISGNGVHKLDPKFLPDGVPKIYSVYILPSGLDFSTFTVEQSFEEIYENASDPNTITRAVLAGNGTKIFGQCLRCSPEAVVFTLMEVTPPSITAMQFSVSSDGSVSASEVQVP